MGGDELLERLVEALDLSLGLGMVGLAVLGRDAQGEELLFGATGEAIAGLGAEDEPIVGEERRWIAPRSLPPCAEPGSSSVALTRTIALEAMQSREWSSMMLRTSKAVPFSSVTWVMSHCQHSLGRSASKRLYELLGRLCGWAFTKPLALSTRQMVDTEGTTAWRSLRWT